MMEGRTKILVIASLVVNLFLAGALIGVLVIGAQMMQERGRDRRGPDRQGVYSAFQAIPEARRDVLRQMMREPAMAAREDMRAAREARRTASELIKAPTYDAAAVEVALRQAREHDAAGRAKLDAALAARLVELTPQERALFADVMNRGPGGMRGGRRGPGGQGGPGPQGGPPPPEAGAK